jgi:cytochrome b involved in lipid metabolism
MLKEHNKKDDAWTCIGGKVYNMTPYLPYHPGGEKELMRVAGRDGTKLFGASFNAQAVERHVIDIIWFVLALTHAWVSAEMMMDACMVGLLVPE